MLKGKLNIPKHFPGKHAALLLAVAVLLLISFLTDHYLEEYEAVDLVYGVPIIAAAVSLSPLETVGTGLLAMIFDLTTLGNSASDLWSVVAIGVAGVLAAVKSLYIRRFIKRIKGPRDSLEGSPLAYAVFSFPGYSLLDYNNTFKQMAQMAGNPTFTSLFRCFPKEPAKQLAAYMDKAIAEQQQVECEELHFPTATGKSTFWCVDFIPDSSRNGAMPRYVTLFAYDVTEQSLRARVRDAALRINTAVMSSLDMEETMQLVLDSLAHIAGTNAGVLFLIEDDQWVRKASYGKYADDSPTRQRIPYDDLSAGVEAVESKKVIAIETVAGHPGIPLDMAKKYKMKSSLIVPLVAGNRSVGVAWLSQTDRTCSFSNEQIEFATVIGSHGALALENASLYEKERTLRKSLEAIEIVSEAGLVTLDLEEVLMELANRTRDVMKLDAAMILLLNESGEYLEVRASTWRTSPPQTQERLKVGEGLAGKAFKEGVPKKIDDLSKNERECPMFAGVGMKSVLAMPLRIDGKVEGILEIGSLSKAAFSVRDWELMQVIADRASLAVQNSALHTQTRQELAKAALLRDVAAACASSLDIKEITNRALDAIYEQLSCHHASIYYLDKEKNTLINLAFKGYTPKAMDQFQTLRLDQEALLARAIQEQRMITHKEVTLDDAKQPETHTLKTLNIDSNHFCILPAIYKGEAVGAMVLVFADKRPLPPHIIETINSIADHLAVAIHSCARASQGPLDAAGIDSPESLPPHS